ncbi:hypothetical protein [Ferruginibacter albus]|uniref:hypothetical protein n=1 Tax=Ferruginibacter albus TaxID=2875540 RepID=UPI001CC6A045|nr:hypothetical protein [Ferruginibacter albus]UAY52478.1 hypothetical protein K9M53_02020 [Ferruginibacter albus]
MNFKCIKTISPKNLIAVLLAAIMFTGCSKNSDTGNPPGSGGTVESGVYIAGTSNNVATYWKNGTIDSLTHTGSFAQAKGIIVTNTDIYIAGAEGEIIKYWKNGTPTRLSVADHQSGDARFAYISGNDFYVVGYEDGGGADYVAKYWKNGVETVLQNGLQARAIQVVGNDVYVVGTSVDGKPVYWKNGVPVYLPFVDNYGNANSICVVGNDVYVVGDESGLNQTPHSIYWKNGIATNLAGGDGGSPKAICVVNNDVYIAGYTGSAIPAYWKNGTINNLANPNTERGYAYSMCFSGNDMYICGGFYPDQLGMSNERAAYWKNGVRTDLTDGTNTSSAYSIFVK